MNDPGKPRLLISLHGLHSQLDLSIPFTLQDMTLSRRMEMVAFCYILSILIRDANYTSVVCKTTYKRGGKLTTFFIPNIF
jgi:hypothetical protein